MFFFPRTSEFSQYPCFKTKKKGTIGDEMRWKSTRQCNNARRRGKLVTRQWKGRLNKRQWTSMAARASSLKGRWNFCPRIETYCRMADTFSQCTKCLLCACIKLKNQIGRNRGGSLSVADWKHFPSPHFERTT